MNSQHEAEAGELYVQAELRKNGYDVLIPISHASRYDVAIVKDGHLVKIQVKNLKPTKSNNGSYTVNAYSVDPRTGDKRPYKPGEVDILVGYNLDDDTFVAIPMNKVNGDTITVSKEGNFKDYFDNWKAIDEVYGNTMVANKLSKLNQAIEEIVQDMIRAKETKNRFESEICYWQLQGIMYALDLLGLYDPRQHRPIEKECDKYLEWLSSIRVGGD